MASSSFSLTIVVAAAIGFFTLFHKKFRLHQKSKTTASSSSLSLSFPPSSSLSLSPPSSSPPRNWIHHVFPSFHGADVREGFLSHVMKEFKSKGIDQFIDNDIGRGKSIGPELIKAIEGSRIAIVLLSKNYASSTWCLNELVEIMECRKKFGQTVMTLFYKVDPSDVKKQTGDFGKVFRKTCKGKTKDNIKRWRHALAEVATIAGEHSSNWDNEAKMIENIATNVSNELNNSAPSSDFDSLVGMESHMTNMGSLLQLDLEEVRIIGIWGMSGIGKTTIARFLFDRHSKNFQLSIFMENIKSTYTIQACSDDYGVKKYLQKEFMSQIINHEDIKIPHLGIIKDMLKYKKVLIVLDDVDRLVQLQAMAKEIGWFGPWSRIIVTTQDQKLLRAHEISHIYKVDFPSSDEALQIFCMYAFDQKSPKDGFTELAWEASRLAGELPLGLRVMGSYFRGMSMQDWTMALPRLKKCLDGEIESILKLCYDALCDEDKELFLYIACLFRSESVDNVKDYLANSFSNVTQGLHVLVEKSLIYMDSGRINMHDLLVKLGKEIVRKQSVYKPWKRQFLVDTKDIVEVLNNDKADSSSIIGINLSVSYMNITCTSETAFERLSNLQFLRIDGYVSNWYFQGNMNISGKLRLLMWTNFPKTCLPSNFHTQFLVTLYMPGPSKLEKLWEGIQPLSNLKTMDLYNSNNLKELPDFSTATNLRELDLLLCSGLVEIPSSIGHATNLQKLILYHCASLVKLPSSIGNAINLQELNLSHCSSLVQLPSSIGNAINLQTLDLSVCSRLMELPSSIGHAINLQKLNLDHCSSLVKLPFSIGNLINLQKLNLGFCSSLVELPSSIGNAINLQELNLSHCSSLVELPSSIGKLCKLSELDLEECSNLESLAELDVSKSFHETSTYNEDLMLSGTATKEIQEFGPWTGRISCLDCFFLNPDIILNLAKCFKLNQEARDLIIHTPTNRYAVLPGGELPECFTYRALGSFVTVKSNQKLLRTSTLFKVCILLYFEKGNSHRNEDDKNVYCSITSKQNDVTCRSKREIEPFLEEHLYIFEVEAEEVTSTDLDFEFELRRVSGYEYWEIKECGVFQLGDGDEDYETSDRDEEE